MIYKIDYLKEFRCICAKCEDTCCSRWNINISKKDYQKYKSISNEKLNIISEENIKKLSIFERRKNMYAFIKLNKDKLCMFLDENKLCKIQLSHGEDFLANSCNTFPRITTKIGDRYETVLSIACPEAARIVLLRSNTFEFEEANTDDGKAPFFSNEVKGLNNKIFFKTRKYFHTIRDLSVSIIKNSDINLWERLVLLGIYYSDITILSRNKQYDSILDYSKAFIQNSKLALTNKLKNQSEQKQKLVTDFLKDTLLIMKNNNNNNIFSEVIENTFKAFEYNENDDQNTFHTNYIKLMKECYLPFEKEFPYIMENFMLNYIYLFGFPFKTAVSINDYYLIIMVQFAILRILIAGNLKVQTKNPKEIAVEVLFSYSRLFLHTDYLMKIILLNFRRRNLHNMDVITQILSEI